MKKNSSLFITFCSCSNISKGCNGGREISVKKKTILVIVGPITNMALAFYQSHPGAVSIIQVKLPSFDLTKFLEPLYLSN